MRSDFIESNYNLDLERSNENYELCYRCDGCGWNFYKRDMEVHHKHYHKPFGQETREDVLILCKGCHEKYDKIRAKEGKDRSNKALSAVIYNSGYRTWIIKRYGESAMEYYYGDELEHERFQDFLNRENY